jgi:hypothetical protein
VRLALRDRQCVVLGQAVFALEARGHRARQLRHVGANPFDPVGRDHQRGQVRIREVAVVVRFFLAAHGTRLAPAAVAVRIEQGRRLLHRAAVLDQVDLPLDLAVDRLLQELEAVQVLDLAARAVRRTRLAHRHVGVAAEAAFLHVAVADAQPHDQCVQCLRVLRSLDAGAHVRLGDDLEQRRAGAVEVDAGLPGVVLVQRLAGVLLEVGARQVDPVRRVANHELDRSTLHHRSFVLADLVPLGQVGVEVVLAREDRVRRHLRADCHAEADRPLDRAAVHHRQRAGQGQIDRRRLCVGLGAELRRRAAEDLALGRQLRMRFEADHHLVPADELAGCGDRHAAAPVVAAAGACRFQSVACWKAWAACSKVPSWK